MNREDFRVQLAKNFYLSEFIFSDFYSPLIQKKVIEAFESDLELMQNCQALADNLQVLRDYLGSPISINISYRPKFWELKQGRSGKSQHVKAWAADIVCDDYSPAQVADAIDQLIDDGKMKEGGLGRYNSFTHYDIRGFKARW